MRLYLDDDSADPLLAQLLRNGGHDVQLPQNVGLSGQPDPVHLTHAISDTRVLLTKNYRDFEYLHNLIVVAVGHHPGILVVRQDNDPKRDLTPGGIVRALAKLEARGYLVAPARHNLPPITAQLDLVDHEREIVPGIHAIAAPGHTPGHMALAINSGGD